MAHWSLDGSRGALARMFDNSLMKRVSRRTIDPKQTPFVGDDTTDARQLRQIAETFVRLQDQRHVADYDNTTWWTQSDANEEVARTYEAFTTWHSIRHQQIAQNYLVALLIKPRD